MHASLVPGGHTVSISFHRRIVSSLYRPLTRRISREFPNRIRASRCNDHAEESEAIIRSNCRSLSVRSTFPETHRVPIRSLYGRCFRWPKAQPDQIHFPPRVSRSTARQLHRGVYAYTVLSTATDRGQAFKQELVAVQSIAYVSRPREHATRLGNRPFSIEDRKRTEVAVRYI